MVCCRSQLLFFTFSYDHLHPVGPLAHLLLHVPKNRFRSPVFAKAHRRPEVFSMIFIDFPQPIGSMYGIYTNIGGILMVNVTLYIYIYRYIAAPWILWAKKGHFGLGFPGFFSFSNPGDVFFKSKQRERQASPVAWLVPRTT